MMKKGSKRTHCLQGHELTVENTYVFPKSGKRTCKFCIDWRTQVKRTGIDPYKVIVEETQDKVDLENYKQGMMLFKRRISLALPISKEVYSQLTEYAASVDLPSTTDLQTITDEAIKNYLKDKQIMLDKMMMS